MKKIFSFVFLIGLSFGMHAGPVYAQTTNTAIDPQVAAELQQKLDAMKATLLELQAKKAAMDKAAMAPEEPAATAATPPTVVLSDKDRTDLRLSLELLTATLQVMQLKLAQEITPQERQVMATGLAGVATHLAGITKALAGRGGDEMKPSAPVVASQPPKEEMTRSGEALGEGNLAAGTPVMSERQTESVSEGAALASSIGWRQLTWPGVLVILVLALGAIWLSKTKADRRSKMKEKKARAIQVVPGTTES